MEKEKKPDFPSLSKYSMKFIELLFLTDKIFSINSLCQIKIAEGCCRKSNMSVFCFYGPVLHFTTCYKGGESDSH